MTGQLTQLSQDRELIGPYLTPAKRFVVGGLQIVIDTKFSPRAISGSVLGGQEKVLIGPFISWAACLGPGGGIKGG